MYKYRLLDGVTLTPGVHIFYIDSMLVIDLAELDWSNSINFHISFSGGYWLSVFKKYFGTVS